jgi:hypothetical protein
MAQIASFYPGAMSEARLVELAPIVERVGTQEYSFTRDSFATRFEKAYGAEAASELRGALG